MFCLKFVSGFLAIYVPIVKLGVGIVQLGREHETATRMVKVQQATLSVNVFPAQVCEDVTESSPQHPGARETFTPIMSRIFLGPKRENLTHSEEPLGAEEIELNLFLVMLYCTGHGKPFTLSPRDFLDHSMPTVRGRER